MTIYRGTVLDTPESPFTGGVLRAESDAGIAVTDGVITDRGPFNRVRAAHPDAEVVDLTGGMVLPGLVDTHVHFPQLRVIGALGMPLLDWLDRCALPEEARMADADYARAVAAEFVDGLIRAGTTTALVFGAHFASAVDCLFERAAASGVRVSAGLVVSDRLLRPELLTTPEQAHEDGLALAGRWHRKDRLRYAVTPRFSLSASAPMLESCAALLRDVDGALFTSHVNENTAEIDDRARAVPRVRLLRGHLRPLPAAPAAQRAGAQRAPRRRRAGPAGRGRRERGALPILEQCAGQRAVPVAPARRARGAGGAGHRRGRRHQLLASARGPTVLLHAGPARRRTGCR